MPLCAFACDCALDHGDEASNPRPILVYSRPKRRAGNRTFRGACYAVLLEAMLWGAAMAAGALYHALFHR